MKPSSSRPTAGSATKAVAALRKPTPPVTGDSGISPKEAAAVFLLCLVPRIIYLLSMGSPGDAAAMYYWELSESLLRHGVLGEAGRPSTAFEPLYPIFLAAARWLTNDDLARVIVLQSMLAAVGAIYFFRLCRLLSGDSAVAWIGVAMFSLHPYLVRQSDAIIEISTLATLLIVSAWYYCRTTEASGAIVCGFVFGLTLLARMAVLPAFILAAMWMLVEKRRTGAVLVIVTLVTVAPMSARNYLEDGSWVLTRSGENLLVANSEYSDRFIPEQQTDLLSIFYLPKLFSQEP